MNLRRLPTPPPKISIELTPEQLLVEAIKREACVSHESALRDEDFLITLEDIAVRIRNVRFARI